jgi:predicted enzyme related to lactoylglutathione lyase
VPSSVLNVTFDCENAETMALFWSGVLGWPASRQEMPGNPYWLVGDPENVELRLVFVTVPENKTTKNRLHLDLLARSESQADELARIESLGARIVDDRRHREPGGWVVLEDPEGNEFCLEGDGS